MDVPAELTTMSLARVVDAGLRASPDAAERPELKTLHWLSALRRLMVDRVSDFVLAERAHRHSLEAIANAPGVTEDERRQMAAMFEVVDISVKAEPILAALVEAGLARRAGAFRAVVALASDDDADFTRLDADFGSEKEFEDAIAAYVTRTPALVRWVEEVRAELDDDERLDWLVARLAMMGEGARARLPEALRLIHAISYFEGQIFNGGIHQAFFNASGDLAPDVAAGLRRLGLDAQASIVERGISMFPAPYPGDIGLRRSHFQNGSDWDQRLARVGEHMDMDTIDAIRPALVELARREGLLPK